MAMLLAIWKCCWLCCQLSGNPAGYMAILLAIWQFYWLSDNSAGSLTMLWPSENVAGYLAMLLPIWQCSCLSGNAAAYLTMLLPIRLSCLLSGNAADYSKGWPPTMIVVVFSIVFSTLKWPNPEQNGTSKLDCVIWYGSSYIEFIISLRRHDI